MIYPIFTLTNSNFYVFYFENVKNVMLKNLIDYSNVYISRKGFLSTELKNVLINIYGRRYKSKLLKEIFNETNSDYEMLLNLAMRLYYFRKLKSQYVEEYKKTDEIIKYMSGIINHINLLLTRNINNKFLIQNFDS